MIKPKRVYRIEAGRMITGVCGGVAEYFNVDPSLVRIIWAAAIMAGGAGLWTYLLASFILPKKSEVYPD